MTNERHEKALEAAEEMMEYGASFGEALKAYLKEGCAVIVPREPTEEMIGAGIVAYDGNCESSYLAMLSKAPNHFTNGE